MRKGSALLIVLGMMVFMVVSAVGFLVYMRESRAPSSHLRREATSRQLLKSALANAISQIDLAIGDAIYPGTTLGTANSDNHWPHRVFTPASTVSPDMTISTLTLESLAYLPPAIINEARIYSRQTQTAIWQNLAYDLGRYAYSAINVSDCFDINKILANARRTSSADSRISLAPLFPENSTQLDTIVQPYQKDNEIPLVSMADFNVIAGQSGSDFAPLMKYLKNGGASGHIYARENPPDVRAVSNALFITDTWFPSTNDYLTTDLELKPKSVSVSYDLADEKDQPFKTYDANGVMDSILKQNGRAKSWMYPNLGIVGNACLYDYLDEDAIPLSYCLPCTETAPMVCGLGLIAAEGFKFKLDSKVDKSIIKTGDGKNAKTIEVKVHHYNFKMPTTQLMFSSVVTLPFKRTKLKELGAEGYNVQLVAKMFFAPYSMKCRVGKNSGIYPQTENDWQDGIKDGIITISGVLTPENKIEGKDTPQTDREVTFNGSLLTSMAGQEIPIFHVVEKTEEGKDKPFERYYSMDGIDPKSCFQFYSETDDGGGVKFIKNPQMDTFPRNEKLAEIVSEATLPTKAKDGNPAEMSLIDTELVPHIAVFVRIAKGNEVCDVVPAGPHDDITWGKRAGDVVDVMNMCFGLTPDDNQPILDFRGEKDKHFQVGESAAEILDGKEDNAIKLAWDEMYAVDPRYNYAAEDWFVTSGAVNPGRVTGEKWCAHLKQVLGQDGRDRDIFMFTSDQEYLQSIGEFQFLPFVQAINGKASGFEGTFKESVKYDGADLANRVGGPDKATGSASFFWRTYNGYERETNSNFQDNPYKLCDANGNILEITAGKGGFKINPFSEDMRVMSAVIMDTPYDYYIASTNKEMNQFSDLKGDAARSYAFGEKGSCDRWTGEQSQAIVEEFRLGIREGAQKGMDWEEAMRRCLDWDDDKGLFGVDLNYPLHGVDRKFLFSFWHECFQNRQQLFLIFMRAEPLTVGGSSGDALANAQLGARGVALVWRDPAPPMKDGKRIPNAPHRTRVLFYHQFD